MTLFVGGQYLSPVPKPGFFFSAVQRRNYCRSFHVNFFYFELVQRSAQTQLLYIGRTILER
jgi:hypothetical protein